MKNKVNLIIPVIFLIIIILIGIVKTKDKKANKDIQEKQDIAIIEQNEIIEENTIIEETEKKEENNIVENSTKKETNTITNKEEKNSTNENNQKTEKKITVKSTFNEKVFEKGYLKNHPNFAEKYATLKIKKIGIDAPIYFGITDEIILKGIGHDSGSYFPGENGTIIMCEHNYMNNFKRLGELKNGDIIEIQANYGDFYYKLYDEQIVLETETDKLPIQKSEEILMIYTCYPTNNTGKTQYRYVIYAKKI